MIASIFNLHFVVVNILKKEKKFRNNNSSLQLGDFYNMLYAIRICVVLAELFPLSFVWFNLNRLTFFFCFVCSTFIIYFGIANLILQLKIIMTHFTSSIMKKNENNYCFNLTWKALETLYNWCFNLTRKACKYRAFAAFDLADSRLFDVEIRVFFSK